jgi:hypothetical protein
LVNGTANGQKSNLKWKNKRKIWSWFRSKINKGVDCNWLFHGYRKDLLIPNSCFSYCNMLQS